MQNKKKGIFRIALVSEYFYPANNAPATRFKPLADELSKHFELTILTSKISQHVKHSCIKCNWTSFPDNTRSIVFRLFFEIIYSVETFFRLLFSRYDYYYLTSPSFFNCIAAYIFCRVAGKPFIVDIRDDYPRVFFDTGLIKENSLAGRFLKYVEKSIYTDATLVVAATAGLASNIKAVHDREVYLLRNGFSELIFKHSPEKYSIFTLVLHGNLSSFQGIDAVIELGKALDQYKGKLQILIIGKGSDDHKLKNCNGEIIKYLGQKPHHEISGIIEKAHVGLSLRKSGKISEDAFPVRAYEYIGVCLPILVTPKSEAGRYIENLKIGYEFEESDISAMVDKIKELMYNTELYFSLVENLKESRLQFSREKLSKEFVEFFLRKIKP